VGFLIAVFSEYPSTDTEIQRRKGPDQTLWKPAAANFVYNPNVTRPIMEPFTDNEEEKEPAEAPDGASKLGIAKRGSHRDGPSGGAAGLA
jgi:hypothetical protein